MNYLDHFSSNSTNYLSSRPTYPRALFDFLRNLVDAEAIVWDCGTGNGQAAYALSKRFQYIVATDRSVEQLKLAKRSRNIWYACSSAEQTPINEAIINLVTIAQALHWFKLDSFYKEVQRVATDNAYLAAWCYSLCHVNKNIDAIVAHFYNNILGASYWPNERRYVDEEYKTIPFPFDKIPCPRVTIVKKINLFDFLGYLNSWSAVKEYERKNGKNPLSFILKDLQEAWGKIETKLTIRWPVHLIVGKIKTSS